MLPGLMARKLVELSLQIRQPPHHVGLLVIKSSERGHRETGVAAKGLAETGLDKLASVIDLGVEGFNSRVPM